MSRQITQGRPADALPAERVSGIGGILIKAKDPKALGQWHRDKFGVPRPHGQLTSMAADTIVQAGDPKDARRMRST